MSFGSASAVETLLARLQNLDSTEVALAVMAVAIILVLIFWKGWKRANVRREGLQRELAEKKARLADTRDKFYLEERNSEALTAALEKANKAFAGKEYELTAARQKIASLNDENDAVYASYLETKKALKGNSVELQYWQYFARRVLQSSRLCLKRASELMTDSLRSKDGAAAADALELLQFSQELVELADTIDLSQHIREMRADGARTVIHLVPRLQLFVHEQQRILGSRFIAKIPETPKPVLFAGSWVHLDLILTTMLDNATAHGIESSKIDFEFSTTDNMATFKVTNRSPTPVAEAVIRATNDLVIGEHQRTRFGLYLMEQVANGYRAIFKIQNIGYSESDSGHLVCASFSVALR